MGSAAAPRESAPRNLAVDLSARYFFLPGRRLQPNLGAGLGYENIWRDTNREAAGGDFSRTRVPGNVQAGFLYHLNERVALDFNPRLNKTFETGCPPFFSGGIGLKVKLGKQR